MAQTVHIAAGQTAATGSPVVTVASGGTAKFQITAPAGARIPRNISLPVISTVDSIDRVVGSLNFLTSEFEVGPGIYRVDRPDIAAYATNITVTVDA